MPQTIINQLDAALGDTLQLLSSFSEKEINKVPFEGSWTAAQVCRHLYKSEDGMDNLFSASATVADRDPEQRAPEYKNILMNYEKKLQSPDFLIPEDKDFDKEKLAADLKKAKDKVLEAVSNTNLNEVPPLQQGHPLEGSTKLELIHFLAYHTIRHNHQLRKIKEKL
jgi:hypothetical protein